MEIRKNKFYVGQKVTVPMWTDWYNEDCIGWGLGFRDLDSKDIEAIQTHSYHIIDMEYDNGREEYIYWVCIDDTTYYAIRERWLVPVCEVKDKDKDKDKLLNETSKTDTDTCTFHFDALSLPFKLNLNILDDTPKCKHKVVFKSRKKDYITYCSKCGKILEIARKTGK